jgi:hypothetical protein
MQRYDFGHSHGGALDQYYASSEWARRRWRYFSRFGRRCEACRSTDRVDLHHVTYRNLHEEADEDLLALCRSCHAECHNLQVQFGWQLEEMTRLFLDHRKQETERADLRASNEDLRRRQAALRGQGIDLAPAPPLELHVQEPPIVVAHKPSTREVRPQVPAAAADLCVVCGTGDPGLGACDACQKPVHVRCGRHRRSLICSVECSIDWMEAFGHA